MSKEITRIECHVTDYGKQRLKDDRFTMIHVDERNKNATLFISPDSTPPRVFTEEQVKKIFQDVLSVQTIDSTNIVVVDTEHIEAIAEMNGISL